MKGKKLVITICIILIAVLLILTIFIPDKDIGFIKFKDNYMNKESVDYNVNAIDGADMVITEAENNSAEYTSDTKVNTVIEQVEIKYDYKFKSIDAEFTDALTGIYIRSCTFESVDGTTYTVFINTLEDGSTIAQVE